MIRCVLGLTVLAFSGAALGSSEAYAGPPYDEKPPAEIEAALTRLQRGGDRTADIGLLGRRDDAAPYLRQELKLAGKWYMRDLTDAFERIEARAWERNKNRFRWWVTGRRFDLCAEMIVACPTDKEAAELVGLVSPALEEVRAEALEILNLDAAPGGGFARVSQAARLRSGRHFSGDSLTISPATNTDLSIVRAVRCEIGSNDPSGAFVAVRSQLIYPLKGMNRWYQSIVLVNSSMPLKAAELSLIICDGDVTLIGPGTADWCVVIANGSIRSPEHRGGSGSLLAATGDIDVPGKNVLYAGGRILSRSNLPPECKKEQQKSLPFGIRFINPKEFGLELVGAFGAGAGVNRVESGSVFAKHDVRAGDLIMYANGVQVNSLAAFRRQLRVGVIQESVVLRIFRGGKTITRIVFLDGIPLPVAPMPHEAKSARP